MLKLKPTLHIEGTEQLLFDGTLHITSEIPSNVFVLAILQNETMKQTAHLTNIKGNEYMTKFNLTPEFTRAELSFAVFNGTDYTYGKKYPIKIDIDKIKLNAKQVDPLKEIQRKLGEFETRLNTYASGFVKPNLPEFNKEFLKPGMVFMILDDQGNGAFMYPFYDAIKEINGIKTIDQTLTLTAEDIPFQDNNVSQTITMLIENSAKQTKAIENLKESFKELIKEVAKIQIDVINERNKDVL